MKAILTEQVFNEASHIAYNKQINLFYADCSKIPSLMNSSFDPNKETAVTLYGLAKFIRFVISNQANLKPSEPSNLVSAIWLHLKKINLKIKV